MSSSDISQTLTFECHSLFVQIFFYREVRTGWQMQVLFLVSLFPYSPIQPLREISRVTGTLWQVWTSAATWNRLVNVSLLYCLPDNSIHLFAVVFYLIPCVKFYICGLIHDVHFTCAFFPLSHRLHGLLRHDLEHEATDASLSFWWSQRRCPFSSVFSQWQPGGLSIQRQDCACLGAEHVSHTLFSTPFRFL